MAERRANVLLVDDRPENLMALEAALEPLGQNFLKATSGEEALKMLLKHEFAVILLDVQMPGMDGFDTAEQIKQREKSRDIPIIFLTAISREPHHALRGYSTGAVDYVSKPYDPWVLRAKVAVFIDLYEKNALLRKQKALLGQRLEERYRAESALEEKAKELERSNADLQQFAYVASHDLQEPLRVMTGYLNLLRDAVKEGADQDAFDFVDRIERSAGRLDALVGALLDLSRVETHSQPFAPTDLGMALDDALAALEVAFEESGAQVTRSEMPVVIGDTSQLCQLLQNLIGNAIKFRGDRAPKIHVQAEQDEGAWLLSVSDNGIGVDPKDTERIFKIFERLNPRDRYAGSGIGLSVCKRIVERHGGRIWVEPNAGGGTTILFTLQTSSTS